MSKHDDQFQPETIYQQIEQLSSPPEAAASTSGALLRDLRDLYKQEEEITERVRTKLGQISDPQVTLSPRNTTSSKNIQTGRKTMHNDEHFQPLMSSRPGSNTPQRPKFPRSLLVAATILLALGLVGSMSFVLMHTHLPNQAAVTPTSGPMTKPETPATPAIPTGVKPTPTTTAGQNACTSVAAHPVTLTSPPGANSPALYYIVGKGGQQTLPSQTQLVRYDLTTGQKSTLYTSPEGESLINAVLSPDKHWLLLSSIFSRGQGIVLQLLRTDGQQLQTLYTDCSASATISEQSDRWSLDGSRIAFVSSDADLQILTLTTGQFQTYLSSTNLTEVYWVNNHQLTIQQNNSNDNVLYLLDTNKGTGQKLSDATALMHISTTCARLSISSDGSRLFNGSCNGRVPQNNCQSGDALSGQSVITSAPSGNTSHTTTIYSNTQDTVVAYAPIGTSQMLLYVMNPPAVTNAGPASHDGLWIINDDGTGLRQLTTGTGLKCWFQDGPYPDYQIASDGQHYALLQVNATSSGPLNQSLVVGKLSGGSNTMIANYEYGRENVLVVVGIGEK